VSKTITVFQRHLDNESRMTDLTFRFDRISYALNSPPTEQTGQYDLNSEGSRLESRPGHRLS
jgi:hypothetical protein